MHLIVWMNFKFSNEDINKYWKFQKHGMNNI